MSPLAERAVLVATRAARSWAPTARRALLFPGVWCRSLRASWPTG